MGASRGGLVFVWGLVRLPLLLAALYLLRYQILAGMERFVDIELVTLYVIDVFSTPATRILYFLAVTLLLSLGVAATRRLRPPAAYAVLVLVGWGIVAASYWATMRSMPYTLPALLLLATNLAPRDLLRRLLPEGRVRGLLMLVGIGVGEVLFFNSYIRWLLWHATGRARWDRASSRWMWSLPAILIAAGASAMLLKGETVVPLEQAMRMPASVRVLALDDFNWVQVDRAGRYLFATGHGLDHLRRYDLANWSSPPLESDATTGNPQGFAYDPASEELYVYDESGKNLLYFDAATLRLKRSFELREVSPGDTWITVDDRTDTISIASEADEQRGVPLLLVDRTSGRILDRKNEEAGNVLLAPQKPLLYLSFFRRVRAVKIYDLEQHAIVRERAIGERAERMAMWEGEHELLVTLPMESRVARLDADSLEPKGYFSTLFGVRAIAIDKGRNLLFCGSIASGRIAVVDLATGQQRASYYLGPWLRTIELMPERGIAYVSSNGALYELRYDQPR